MFRFDTIGENTPTGEQIRLLGHISLDFQSDAWPIQESLFLQCLTKDTTFLTKMQVFDKLFFKMYLMPYLETHPDPQIRKNAHDQTYLFRRLATFLLNFQYKKEKESEKTAFICRELRFIKGCPHVDETPHLGLRKALYDARNVRANEWTGVLVEYSELLCPAGKGLKTRLVDYRLSRKAHLINYIRLLEVAHYYGYDIDDNN